MDFKQIQELIKIVGKSELSELSIEQDKFKITLKKAVNPVVVQQPLRSAAAAYAQAQTAVAENGGSAEFLDLPAPAKKEKTIDNGKYITIKSPMVGTFYRSPSPDKEPFVKVGDIIRKGDHICVIEAMKLFNEIESEFDGKVVKVVAEDASPVEYEQPLFLIEPA
ncbi:MAG: acetyl-CoA carboxylase biotin carboxyl carrier protein [Chitinophagales bacterium]|nr:acetyl-CoA carboxylase biotin carboxyl carrier protein [Chitinophagales bacterium]